MTVLITSAKYEQQSLMRMRIRSDRQATVQYGTNLLTLCVYIDMHMLFISFDICKLCTLCTHSYVVSVVYVYIMGTCCTCCTCVLFTINFIHGIWLSV